LICLLLAAWLCWPGASAQGKPPAQEEPWSDEVFTKPELQSSQELQALLKRIESGDFPRIEFKINSDSVRPDSLQTLDAIAHFLLQNESVKLQISAYTCKLGSQEYNQDLSERRAKAVADYLIRRGVPPPSIRWKGWGSSHPIADNSTEDGRNRNRRVEFHFLHNDWNSVY
jgi:outer membrane protein OmpA-like peptidoglycan-associated protein